MSQPSHPPNPPDPPQSVEDEARQHIAIRVEELQNKLRSTNDPAQAANISAALNIYSKGEIPGGSKYALTYFQGGRIVDSPSKIDFLGPWLIEGCPRQLSQSVELCHTSWGEVGDSLVGTL